MRVAYFPDSFHEVNGVAHTSRQFVAFARRRGLPFLCVRGGGQRESRDVEGLLETLELPRGPFSFALEKDLRFDLGFARYAPRMARTLRAFRPDVVHITGPSELGMLGAVLAHRMGIPLAASWHTNVHEYSARRLAWLRRMLPGRWTEAMALAAERGTFWLSARFYSTAQLLFAPNDKLCHLLEGATGRPCRLMQRGVDAEIFSPRRRARGWEDGAFVLGYVGRLSVEKNVELLVRVGRELLAAGCGNFRFLIVGHGAEEALLRRELPQAEFRGVLRGEALSRAYAEMDLLVFPSHTDTFGNVVLEALASGAPAVVTPDGGPCTIVRDGSTGYVREDAGFAGAVLDAIRRPERHAAMRVAARRYAESASWDSIFEQVYAGYASMSAHTAAGGNAGSLRRGDGG